MIFFFPHNILVVYDRHISSAVSLCRMLLKSQNNPNTIYERSSKLNGRFHARHRRRSLRVGKAVCVHDLGFSSYRNIVVIMLRIYVDTRHYNINIVAAMPLRDDRQPAAIRTTEC